MLYFVNGNKNHRRLLACSVVLTNTTIVEVISACWKVKSNPDVAMFIANGPFCSGTTVGIFMSNGRFVCGYLSYAYIHVIGQ